MEGDHLPSQMAQACAQVSPLTRRSVHRGGGKRTRQSALLSPPHRDPQGKGHHLIVETRKGKQPAHGCPLVARG